MLPSTVRAGLTAGLALWLVALPASAQEEAKSTQREEPPPAAVLPAGTRIPLVLENTIKTKNARVGDRLYFQTIYPVGVNNRILIPAGSYVRGSVTFTKRPGRIKGRGELHVRFEELTLPNGYTVDLQASLAGVGTTGNEEVNREEGGIKGEGSKGEDVRTVATTTSAGAGIGALAGRGKGVALGAGVGAGSHPADARARARPAARHHGRNCPRPPAGTRPSPGAVRLDRTRNCSVRPHPATPAAQPASSPHSVLSCSRFVRSVPVFPLPYPPKSGIIALFFHYILE